MKFPKQIAVEKLPSRIIMLGENIDWLPKPRFLRKKNGFFITDEQDARGFIPIRIKHRNKGSITDQQNDISVIISEMRLFSPASYTANLVVFGFLYGYI